MRVMGIDPSTKCGVCIADSGKAIIHTEEIEYKKHTGFERVQLIAGRVLELREQYQPDLLVIEEMFVGHASSAITIIQIGSILRYFLWQEGILYLNVPATTLKKFVAGKGNANKEQMMMFVLKNWGHESKTNNIADAVGLAMFGLGCTGEKFPLASLSCCKDVLKGQPEVADSISRIK